MIYWLDSPLVTLFDAVTVLRSWLVIALLSLVVAWIAHRKRHSPPLWFGIAVGGFIVASEIVRYLIPHAAQEFARGEMPSAAYTMWTDATFRSDFGLLLVVIALVGLLSGGIRRLLFYAKDTTAHTSLRVRSSAIGSALIVSVPVIFWL